MKWLRMVIRSWIGRDRYHDLADEVNTRGLRVELLTKRLEVIERRRQPR